MDKIVTGINTAEVPTVFCSSHQWGNADTAAVAEKAPPNGASPAGFHELILPHLDSAYSLARYLSRDADAADDIVQEAFLRGYRSFGRYRGGDARSWILAITRNCFFDLARARQIDPSRTPGRGVSLHQEDGMEAEFFDPDQETPEGALVRLDEAAKVRAVIETLPEPFREALVLRDIEDLSYQEIAEITAMPIGTVMSRLSRGRQMFADAWRQFLANKTEG